MLTNPSPSPADFAAADAFIAEAYDANPRICRTFLANNREVLVRYAADAVMLKREHAEGRAGTGRRVAA